MLTRPQIYLASIFIKIFYRDRQSLFLSLLFPLIFTGIFLFSGGEPSPTKLGLVNHSQDELSIKFVELVKKEKTFLNSVEILSGSKDLVCENHVASVNFNDAKVVGSVGGFANNAVVLSKAPRDRAR